MPRHGAVFYSSVNLTTSSSVQFNALHKGANVNSVTFLLCFNADNERLSKTPSLRSLYCVIPFSCIVSHRGEKSIIAITTSSGMCNHYIFQFQNNILYISVQYVIIVDALNTKPIPKIVRLSKGGMLPMARNYHFLLISFNR